MKCGICDSTFGNRIIYDAHMIKDHKINPYNCLICPDATFPTHYQLKKHQKEFHDEEIAKETKTEWPCDIPGCRYVGKARRNLWAHKRQHLREKRWKCDQCDYACKLKANLTLHKEMVILKTYVGAYVEHPPTKKSSKPFFTSAYMPRRV